MAIDNSSDYMFTPFSVTPTEYLLARLAKVDNTPADKACDNMSDAGCCDYCGSWELRSELRRRQRIA